MKHLTIAALATVVLFAPANAAEKSPEYSAAYCAGWNEAVTLIQQRAQNWTAMTLAGVEEGDPAKQTNVARSASVIVKSVPIYVLLPPLTGSFRMGSGDTVDCTPPKAPETPTTPDTAVPKSTEAK